MTSSTWLPATATRSRTFFAALVLVLLVETAAIHVWLIGSHPVIAWTATTLSALTLVWLLSIYRGQARAGLELGPAVWSIRAPGRFHCDVPLDATESVAIPSWRDIPSAGSSWINGAAPLDPNLLLKFSAPIPVRLTMGIRRRVSVIGLHLVQPQKAIEAWNAYRETLTSAARHAATNSAITIRDAPPTDRALA